MKKINTYYIAFTALLTILCFPQYLRGQEDDRTNIHESFFMRFLAGAGSGLFFQFIG